MLSNYISIPLFLISFAIGLFFMYILGPEKKTVHVYPSPENADKVLFKDNAENCFRFHGEHVECPKAEFLISQLPIQAE